MAELKLTKNGLRDEERRLSQLNRYLPTLQLKKAMLQAEVQEARVEIAECKVRFDEREKKVEEFSPLLARKGPFLPQEAVAVAEVVKTYENIAGVEVPYFDRVEFEAIEWNLFDTPAWFDGAVAGLKKLAEAKERLAVAEEKKKALEEELRQVSIRVNLFEKILIPRAKKNIKKVKVFLGDQELAAVSRAKVAKTLIEQNK